LLLVARCLQQRHAQWRRCRIDCARMHLRTCAHTRARARARAHARAHTQPQPTWPAASMQVAKPKQMKAPAIRPSTTSLSSELRCLALPARADGRERTRKTRGVVVREGGQRATAAAPCLSAQLLQARTPVSDVLVDLSRLQAAAQRVVARSVRCRLLLRLLRAMRARCLRLCVLVVLAACGGWTAAAFAALICVAGLDLDHLCGRHGEHRCAVAAPIAQHRVRAAAAFAKTRRQQQTCGAGRRGWRVMAVKLGPRGNARVCCSGRARPCNSSSRRRSHGLLCRGGRHA
jgi:hypothetical protein